MSHDHREGRLFVLNRGNLLVLRMEMGKFAEMEAALGAMAGSLTFQSAVTTS